MNNQDKLIEEGEEHLKQYEETKESMLSNPEIPDNVKKILTDFIMVMFSYSSIKLF